MKKTIADIVIDVLNGRGGFDHWWDSIEDADIRRDIKTAINDAVNAHLSTLEKYEK